MVDMITIDAGAAIFTGFFLFHLKVSLLEQIDENRRYFERRYGKTSDCAAQNASVEIPCYMIFIFS